MNPGIVAVIVISVVLFICILIAICNIRIIKQTDKAIVERLGAYHETWGVGIHWLVPFVDHVSKVISMKEQVKDFDPQSVITKDNVTMQIDTVIFFQVTDSEPYAYGVEDASAAIGYVSATTLRNVSGDLELDAALTSRDISGDKM